MHDSLGVLNLIVVRQVPEMDVFVSRDSLDMCLAWIASNVDANYSSLFELRGVFHRESHALYTCLLNMRPIAIQCNSSDVMNVYEMLLSSILIVSKNAGSVMIFD